MKDQQWPHLNRKEESRCENRCDSYGDRIENRCKEQSIRAYPCARFGGAGQSSAHITCSAHHCGRFLSWSAIADQLRRIVSRCVWDSSSGCRRGRAQPVVGTQARRADVSNENAAGSSRPHATRRSVYARCCSFNFWRWLSRACQQRAQCRARGCHDPRLHLRLHPAKTHQQCEHRGRLRFWVVYVTARVGGGAWYVLIQLMETYS